MADDGIDLGDIAQAAVAIAVAYAAQAALNSLTQTKQSSVSQTFPSQLSTSAAYIMVGGPSRVPGLQVFKDVNGSQLGGVQAVHHGHTLTPDYFYLNEDRVTVDGSGWVIGVSTGGTANTDGRYVDQKVRILYRNGLPAETAISEIVSLFPSIWTTDHRGDGVSSVGYIYVSPKAKFVTQAFPSGVPVLNVVTQPDDFYDWRQDSTAGGSGSQRRDDPTTWDTCTNPVVCRVHLEWFRWGRSWDRCIAPVLADLTAEADICDELVSLAAGGTQKRYECAGWYVDDTNRDDIRKKLDASMDGFCTTDGRGRLVIKCGHYEYPTFVLTADYIEDYTWSRGVSRDVRVSKLNATFTDPDSDFNTVPCDPWVIDEAGGKPLPLALDWVSTFTQARRLAKRAAARANPSYTGQIKTGPYGFNGMGQRYIRVQNPSEASMADVVCEVTNVEFDPISGQVVFDVISTDPNIDAWNPATEEGNPVTVVARPNPGALDAPTVTSAVPFYDGVNVRLAVTGAFPARDDLTPIVSWRISGGIWSDTTAGDYVDHGSYVYTANTGVVTPASNLEVRLSYITSGGGLAPYSATSTVNSIVVPAPANLVATSGELQAGVSFTFPTAAFHHCKVLYGATSVIGSATEYATSYSGALGATQTLNLPLTSGIWYIWVHAYDAAGNLSVAVGPVSANAMPAPVVAFDPVGLIYGTPYFKALDGSTYTTFDAMVAAGKANFARASVASARTNAGAVTTFTSGQAAQTNRGVMICLSRTNLLLNSASLSTQSVTVTAQAYTLSFMGTGTVTLSGAYSGSLVGTGATDRVELTFTPTAGTLTATDTGTVTNAQIEAGTNGTAWIPTTGAAVTRSADVASVTGLSALLAAGFSVVAENEMFYQGTGVTQYRGSVSDNSSNNLVDLVRSAAGQSIIQIVAGGVQQQSSVVSGSAAPRTMKAAFTLGLARYCVAHDGTLGTALTSFTRPTGLDRIYFGASRTGGGQANAFARKIAIYPELSDDQLRWETGWRP
jgi:hypothetical protein